MYLSKIIEEEKSIYLSFSEKVIQKIYNVDHYSHTAMKEILNNSIESIEIDKKLKKLVSYLNYRLIGSQIMLVDSSKTYDDWKLSKDKSTSENKIYQFKTQLKNGS